MKVLIMGYGRMGREVEAVCKQRNHEIICRVDKNGLGDQGELTLELLKQADGVVEFALPQGIEKSMELYAQSETPAVVATTGWNDKKEQFAKLFETRGALMHGSNFSIGAHMFFELTARAAQMMDKVEAYDIMVTEYHHKMKIDSPSGTAITTAERILENCSRKKRSNYDRINRAIEEDELHVASVRGGYIPGTHKVLMDSLADSIEITHQARNRGGFALGSVMALEWLQGKQGFFSVDEFIRELLDKSEF
ncbi:MAG: 4-hydroxy-tetrahydrodipicolinate reductase [Spirochaetaceae bacterium]|jgi:4-hydroxy-tetrahydrodipicolinate reductase|nr:4-hydroxy-tetrahydrodipicolinate reductase [Spirochaetaceae bacterium]